MPAENAQNPGNLGNRAGVKARLEPGRGTPMWNFDSDRRAGSGIEIARLPAIQDFKQGDERGVEQAVEQAVDLGLCPPVNRGG